MKVPFAGVVLVLFLHHVQVLESYFVGAGCKNYHVIHKDSEGIALVEVCLTGDLYVNVRFGQLLHTDNKYQVLREEMIKTNTKNLAYHCRADQSECDSALAKMRYKASKHFYALSKAVVDYVKNKRQARPTGYVGTATFCQDNICAPDTDPPIVFGGCYTLISCGGNETWHLDPVIYKKKKARFF